MKRMIIAACLVIGLGVTPSSPAWEGPWVFCFEFDTDDRENSVGIANFVSGYLEGLAYGQGWDVSLDIRLGMETEVVSRCKERPEDRVREVTREVFDEFLSQR